MFGESGKIGQLFLKSTDGSMVKFGGIKTITNEDINFYDEPLYSTTWSADGDMSFECNAPHINLTRVQRLMLLYALESEREARLVLRHKESLRRWQLKEGVKLRFPLEFYAVHEVAYGRGKHGGRIYDKRPE